MNKTPKWEFAPTGGSPDDGIHNSMIEHFEGNYNYYLAREVIQNSLDAKLDEVKDPVSVEFKLEYFQQKEFPEHSDVINIYNKCKEYWIDEDTHKFIENALKVLGKKEIPFLRVSDYNTKGLSGGDYDKNGTWYKLVKSRGSSSKTGGEGGSFGIGKGAPFAASDLRIVFYSTRNEAAFTIFQGVAELVSFEEHNVRKRGIGSYGIDQSSIRDRKNYPSERFWRRTTGTDIYIAGYKAKEGWENDLIRSVLRNFWYAIFKNELSVTIENHCINSSNLEEYLTSNFSLEPYRDDVKPIGNPLQYYLAVTRGKHFSTKLSSIGEVSFYFSETDEFLNHVAMMRKSHMVIFSRLFRYPGSFAGVFVCDNSIGNQELRRMEPPAHDDWTVNRNPENGKKVYDELTSFIRECLEKSKIIRKSEVSEIPDMYKYLPDNDEEENENGNGQGKQLYSGLEGVEETSKTIQKAEVYESPVSVMPYKVTVLNKKLTLEDDEPDEPTEPEGEGKKRKKKKVLKTNDVHVRAFISKQVAEKLEYTIVLKAAKKAKYEMKFFSVGEDITDKLKISNISVIDGHKPFFSGNYVRGVWLEPNKTVMFSITVESKFKKAVKVEVNEIQ